MLTAVCLQFSLLFGVLKDMATVPLPRSAMADSDTPRAPGTARSLPKLSSNTAAAVRRKSTTSQSQKGKTVHQLKRERLQLEWEMRQVETLLAGFHKGRDLEPMSSSESAAFMEAGTGHSSSFLGGGQHAEIDMLQSSMQELMARFASVTDNFVVLLNDIRAREKEKANRSHLQVRNVHVEAYVELVRLTLNKLAKPFFHMKVEGVASSVSVFSDLSAELATEVKFITAVNDELSESHKVTAHPDSRSSHSSHLTAHPLQWSRVLAPLAHGGDKDRWNHQNVMFSLRGKKRSERGRTVVPHLEVNIFPLNVKVRPVLWSVRDTQSMSALLAGHVRTHHEPRQLLRVQRTQAPAEVQQVQAALSAVFPGHSRAAGAEAARFGEHGAAFRLVALAKHCPAVSHASQGHLS